MGWRDTGRALTEALQRQRTADYVMLVRHGERSGLWPVQLPGVPIVDVMASAR